MNDLGEKVRLLREGKGRPVLRGMSLDVVRQLVRIEKENFRPTR